jgi:hypothetical protein
MKTETVSFASTQIVAYFTDISTLKMEAARTSETSLNFYASLILPESFQLFLNLYLDLVVITVLSSNRQEAPTRLYGVTSQKTVAVHNQLGCKVGEWT